ncbi:hypothetical protein BCR39DRAFT_585410 [Naematelia encephala]|uniref:ferric-chelate reductase (NADPH) n=1 Tax=Naematelia encephala TaxID=71784 RepID=A0A1Y2BM11_9TREE|nr:hypothetical protein BCR39DRAFT_585410 [Naematelia encephala]
MPLMVDPSTGGLFQADFASAAVITATALSAAESVSTLIAASAMAVPSSSYDLVASPSSSTAFAASPSVNITQVVKQESATQTSMSDSTPRTLFLAWAGLLVLCILVSHTRFLARVFASRGSKSTKSSQPTSDYPFALQSSQGNSPKRVGGGDLDQGWLLRAGPSMRTSSMSDFLSQKSDPFASPSASISKPTFSPPPHITPLLSHLPFSSKLLLAPFSRLPSVLNTKLNLVQLYIVFGYLLLVAIALIYRSDLSPATSAKGSGSDFMRSGLVAASQLPLVVGLAVRGNLIGLCVGKGYERLKVFHKIVGRVMFVAATVHVICYLHKWAVAGSMSTYIAKPFIIAGLMAWISMIFIILTSLPWVRKTFYGTFEICHFLGMMIMLIGMGFHVTQAIPYCLAAAIIYAISLISSITKTRLATAELVALSSSLTTVVTVPSLRSGWRAGQHVRIRVPALGFPHAIESHPFTIASAPNGDGLVLMAKMAGNWTEQLYELALGGSGSRDENSTGEPRKTIATTIVLEGPYGGLGNTLLPSFSGVVMVAGGSGITHALSLAHDLILRAPSGVVRARTVDLIWVLRTTELAKPLMPTLMDMISDAQQAERQSVEGRRKGLDMAPPVALRITIHITRCPTSSPLDLLTRPTSPLEDPFASDGDSILADRMASSLRRQPSEADKEKLAYLSRNPSTSSLIKHSEILSELTIMRGRPDFARVLESVTDEVIGRHGRSMTDPSGVCVTACGPAEMVGSVRKAVVGLEGWKRRACGGVELEEEYFGF